MKVTQLLTDIELDNINQYLDEAEWEFYTRYHNLFNVRHINVNPKIFETYSIIEKLQKYSKHKLQSFYALEYTAGSFCKEHSDAGTRYTAVTILKSVNLIGGETLAWNRYTDEKSKRALYRPESEKDSETCGFYYPEIVYCKNGDTLWYEGKQKHAVSYVKEGLRRVLIAWFY